MKFNFHGIILSAVLWATTLSASQHLEVFQGARKIHLEFDGVVTNDQLLEVLQPKLDEIDRTANELFDEQPISHKDLVNRYWAACDEWHQKTQGDFSCRLGHFQKIWQAAQQNNELPDRAELRKQARSLIVSAQKTDWFADEFWYSWVLDELVRTLQQKQNVQLNWISFRSNHLQRLWKINNQSNEIQHINFFNEILSKNPVIIENRNAPAIAIIEHNPNAFLQKVNHYWLSRVINPKTGWPIEYPPSIIVTADNVATAQAVAQAILIKSGPEALVWANSLPNVSALLVTETGKIFSTDNWHKPLGAVKSHSLLNKKLSIQYEIPDLNLAEYRRPYFSIWISGSDKNPLHNLQLIGEESRWIRELRHWWRIQGRQDDALIDAFAGATITPGRYEIFWDGRNDQGMLVNEGNYRLNIEIAREHGEHEELSIPFLFDGSAFEISVQGKRELGQVSLQFNPD